MIENESDMPVMDGAEACYPLYAAVAKALYKDIDIIESNNVDQFSKTNGKYVSFTNTIYAFRRLIRFDKGYERTDMVFGARPSAAQLEEAKEEGIDLNITVIGKEAFVFFVEEDNPVDNLTSEQVKQIYHGDIIQNRKNYWLSEEILENSLNTQISTYICLHCKSLTNITIK